MWAEKVNRAPRSWPTRPQRRLKRTSTKDANGAAEHYGFADDSQSRTIAKSHEIIPISVFAKVEMAAASALHQQRRQSGRKLCYDAMLIHAARAAMAQAPRFQGYFDNDRLALAGAANVGVAISAGEDLFIPVVRNADGKSIEQIDDEGRIFADKAGKRALTEAEMSGATFTTPPLPSVPRPGPWTER